MLIENTMCMSFDINLSGVTRKPVGKARLCRAILVNPDKLHTKIHLHMSLVVRKPVFGVSDQVRHK